MGKTRHQHENWQVQDSAKGGHYCAACGEAVTLISGVWRTKLVESPDVVNALADKSHTLTFDERNAAADELVALREYKARQQRAALEGLQRIDEELEQIIDPNGPWERLRRQVEGYENETAEADGHTAVYQEDRLYVAAKSVLMLTDAGAPLDPFPFRTESGPRGATPWPSYPCPLCFDPRAGYEQNPERYEVSS